MLGRIAEREVDHMQSHQVSEGDKVLAAVAVTAVNFAQALREPIVKMQVSDASSEGDASVYMQTAHGQILSAIVRSKLDDGRQFIDYEIYSTVTNDYEHGSAPSLESFQDGVNHSVKRREPDVLGLTGGQRDTAENLFERYDFSYEVEDVGGWSMNFDGDDFVMTRAVYLQADEPHQDSIRSDFIVRFRDGTNVPHEVACMVDGEEVGNIPSGTYADYVVGEIVSNWSTAPAAA
jgi:hypothetical protein